MSGMWERLFQHRVTPFGGVGQDFYVVDSDFAGTTGVADFSGLSDLYNVMAPGRVFPTNRYADDSAAIQAAIDAAVGSRGDTIYLCPGDYRIIDVLAVNERGLRIFGPPVQHPGRALVTLDGDTTAGLADEIINITAADVEIGFLKLIPDSAQVGLDFSAAADGLFLHDLFLDMATPAVSTSTVGVSAVGAASQVRIERCFAKCDGAQGNAIVATALIDSLIQDCDFFLSAGTWASVILCGAATTRLLLRRCEIGGVGTAITVGVNGTGASIAAGVGLRYCDFGNIVTVPVDNFDAGEATLNECYKAGVGATDGGTKITAIT